MSSYNIKSLAQAFSQPERRTGQRFARFYPFWKMKVGEQAIVRFLPDANLANPLGFLIENVTHQLTIGGQKNILPCLGMYDKRCPCCELSRNYYNNNNQGMGKLFWKKKEYIGSISIILSPFPFEGRQKTQMISLGTKIFQGIQKAFLTTEVQDPPFDINKGYNFHIRKTQKGSFADYSQSSFSKKPSALQGDMTDHHSFPDLQSYLTPEIPSVTIESHVQAFLERLSNRNSENSTRPESTSPPSSRPKTSDKGTLSHLSRDQLLKTIQEKHGRPLKKSAAR